MAEPTAPVAFIAGLASFISPCVLPIVPGYLSYMSGLEASSEEKTTKRTGVVALGFVAGFAAIFIALGISATLLGQFLNENLDIFRKVGGVLIIVMGLIFMGLVPIPFLQRERRFHPSPNTGFWGSTLLGAAFAFGWSPCIGTTLGVVLTMAAGNADEGGVAEGAFLLAIYSLGLGLPFIAAGFGLPRLAGVVAWLRRHSRGINLASGALLVVFGILFFTNQFFELSAWMYQELSDAGLNFWTSL